MADRSSIEWTDATLNPIRARATATGRVGWHCEHASEGCRNCYAERQNRGIFGNGLPYKPGLVRTGAVELFLDETMLFKPLRWRRPRTIFVCSMTDLFADFVPDAWIDQVFAMMSLCPQHLFQVLTKRPDRMRAYMRDRAGKLARFIIDEYLIKGASDAKAAGRAINVAWPVRSIGDIDHPEDVKMRHWPLPNVWLGTSIEARPELLRRAGDLRMTPAAKRFFSCEPLLGDLGDVLLDGIDWVICGGESGKDARPMHPDWVRSLRDQCASADVPFFFKQWGEWAPGENAMHAALRTERTATWFDDRWSFGQLTPAQSEQLHRDDEPDLFRLGKKASGRLLDGFEHKEMPA